MSDFAENERLQGYIDGADPDAPEPSANRSASYRHGFAVRRADRRGQPAFGGTAAARERSEIAEREDASR